MQRFLRAGFVRSENLSFTDLGDGFVELEGVIECAGNVYIDPPEWRQRSQAIAAEAPCFE